MSRTAIVLVLGAGVALATMQACGSDGGSASSTTSSTTGSTGSTGLGGAGATTGTTTGSGGGAPSPLGAQIDRMGRPTINAATNHAFDPNMATKSAAKDAWNQMSDPAEWPTLAPAVAKSIAMLDGIDAVCGNQMLAGAQTGTGRYAKLSGMLADDRLWLDTDATTCSMYLAVEANASGAVPNADCGGRKPSYDVIDESYSMLVEGKVSGMTDGIDADADTTVDTFPYLAPPH